MNRFTLYILFTLLLSQCTSQHDSHNSENLFQLRDASDTNIDFENTLTSTEEFNMYIFRNFYNGGGVAVGDVSGDGLPDIFFTGNMTSNRLYINQGDFTFSDITNSAGLDSDGYWSTGASMADINGDGLLDIYVTLSGQPDGDKRYNRLYINNGDPSSENNGSGLTFSEKAQEYNLLDNGLSTQGVFFDYNGDNRLDFYLLSNSFHKVGGYENATGTDRQIPDPRGASKLYRNNGDSFTDVTSEAGIYSSVIGFGMSATAGDVNRDGLTDLFVANDFFERDYLYINNGDGTFSESLPNRIQSGSLSSMGSDIADINNDGWPEIYVTDMLPEDESRLKSKMTIESWDDYQKNVQRGFHHSFTRNTLQLNRGGGEFSEIGRYANVEATDWSWAALIADFNNSGRSDIFVTNGIYKDLLDQDYIEEVSNAGRMRQRIQSGEKNVILNLMNEMSSTPLSNYVFRNENGVQFSNQTEAWGLDQPGFSTGAAWADLDNDGDLDLVINDVNGPARIYQNRVNEIHPERTWLKVNLKGDTANTFGLGAQLEVWADGKYWYREYFLQRGFQSSVEPGLHVGLGEIQKVDSLLVRWPDGRTSRKTNISVPAEITVMQSDAVQSASPTHPLASLSGDLPLSKMNSEKEFSQPLLEEKTVNGISEWKHNRYEYNDFDRERLLFHMRSTEGPALCTGDVNGDDLDDVYIGGAREQAGRLFIQNKNGNFYSAQEDLFEKDAISEDTDCAFFDATGNGLDDLYVVSGGNSFSSGSSALSDRFYVNDGHGAFTKTNQVLPTTRAFEPGSVVAPYDFNEDGNLDLFVGIRLKPFAVGIPVNGYLLTGDGNGQFVDVTDDWAPSLLNFGMITDAIWTDLTGDGKNELVVTGEWMSPHVYEMKDNHMEEITEELGLTESSGWWNSIASGDIDGDGRNDLIVTNHGRNSRFHASSDFPVKMWVSDMSQNGMIEQIIATEKGGTYYPSALYHDLVSTILALREKYPTYKSFAGQSMDQIFSEEELNHSLELNATHLESVIFWNRPEGMVMEELPLRAQLSPMYGVEIQDLDGDQYPEIVLGGNLYDVKPETGPYDASEGVVLTYKNGQLHSYNPQESGLHIGGEIRSIQSIKIGGEPHLILARFNQKPVIMKVRNYSVAQTNNQ